MFSSKTGATSSDADSFACSSVLTTSAFSSAVLSTLIETSTGTAVDPLVAAVVIDSPTETADSVCLAPSLFVVWSLKDVTAESIETAGNSLLFSTATITSFASTWIPPTWTLLSSPTTTRPLAILMKVTLPCS